MEHAPEFRVLLVLKQYFAPLLRNRSVCGSLSSWLECVLWPVVVKVSTLCCSKHFAFIQLILK